MMDGVVSQSSAMSQRLSQLTHLLEQSISKQEAFMHSQQRKQSGVAVQDVEEWKDDGTSEA